MNFEPTHLVCITTTGEYRIERTRDGDWQAQWAGPMTESLVSRFLHDSARHVVNIDARDADGNAHDWPSRDLAEEACEQHRNLLAEHGPQKAADMVGARHAEAIQTLSWLNEERAEADECLRERSNVNAYDDPKGRW